MRNYMHFLCIFLVTITLIDARNLKQMLGGEDVKESKYEPAESQKEEDRGKLRVINGELYYIEDVLSATWTEAALECRNQGMFLASFETVEEFVPVYQYLFKKGKFWTSGRYLADKWVWMTCDEAFTLNKYWLKQQPDLYDVNDSYIIVNKKGLEDDNNEAKHHFICEY